MADDVSRGTRHETDRRTEIPVTRRVIESHTLYSAHLHEERTIKVYRPQALAGGTPLPVLYAHDGVEFFTHGRIATIAQQLITAADMAPLIIVGIAVRHSMRSDDYAYHGSRNAAYVAFVLEECMPYIERQYPIATASRSMAGISLGASVTLQLSLQARQLFSSVLLFSGAYPSSLQNDIQKETDLHSLKVWMLSGTEETAVQTPFGQHDFLQANRLMAGALKAAGAKVTYTEAPGTHIWGFWQQHTPAALRWLTREDKVGLDG